MINFPHKFFIFIAFFTITAANATSEGGNVAGEAAPGHRHAFFEEERDRYNEKREQIADAHQHGGWEKCQALEKRDHVGWILGNCTSNVNARYLLTANAAAAHHIIGGDTIRFFKSRDVHNGIAPLALLPVYNFPD